MESIFRLYLPDEDRALLDLVARRTGRSRSAIVREALEAHLPALLLQRSGPDEGAA
jgi:predicted DNA-binding protein